MNTVTELAPAKLNLRLKLQGRRKDGYHLLSMLNVQVSLGDRLDLKGSKGAEILFKEDLSELKGVGRLPNRASDNIIVKSLELCRREFGIDKGLEVSLKKIIPIGAGLGGGSSDAAAALRGFAKLYASNNFQQLDERLYNVAIKVGADVPYLLKGGLTRVSGIGEILQRVPHNPLASSPVVILIPSESISTADIFEDLRSRGQEVKSEADEALARVSSQAERLSRRDILKLIQNDLETVVSGRCQVVKDLLLGLSELEDIVFSLSGSGSAIFALSEEGGPISVSSNQSIQALAERFGVELVHSTILA